MQQSHNHRKNIELFASANILDEEDVKLAAEAVLPDGYSVEPSRKNKDTQTLTAVADGQILYFHNRFDPVNEARDIIAAVPSSVRSTVIFGAGLGYTLDAAFERGFDRILIFEYEPFLFRAAIDRLCLEKYPETRIFAWIGDVTEKNLERYKRFLSECGDEGCHVIANPAFERVNASFVERFAHTITMEKHSGEIKKIYDKTNEKFSKREMSLSECISFLSAPEYLMLRLHELELPHVLRIEPTNFCNLRCRMCPSPGVSNDRRGFMDIRLYEQILVEMKSRHPSRQYFIFLYLGGEPLMHKNICEMVDLAGSFGYITQINTNAMLLTAGLAERLIKTTLNYLYISFDDVTPAEYEHYRQGASYEKVGENIKTLLKIKKERGGENPLVTLAALRFPKEGDDDLNYAPRPSKELSNMFPGVSILVNWAHHWSSDFVSDVDGMPKIKPSTEYYPCPLLWRDMAIRWDGTVAACCYDLRGEHIIGKFPEQSLLDIWNGRAATALRQAHVMGRVNEIPLCRECSSLWVDRGLKEYFGEYAPFYLKKTL